jgi:hypothetical protein
MAQDKRNSACFPHDVYFASFTKSSAYIVDKLDKKGQPYSAVRYGHRYGYLTDQNDAGTLKKMVQEDPLLMERPFTLRPPRKQSEGRPAGDRTAMDKQRISRVFAPKGALARAVKAGIISKAVAVQMENNSGQ